MIEWSAIAQNFSLGNAAILTNVCLLPLYPGLIAFLAGNVQAEQSDTENAASSERSIWVTALLGVFVLMGILWVMIVLALILHGLKSSFADIFNYLLPAVYLLAITLGVLMVMNRNPFTRVNTVQAPILKNPFVTAFLYGALLGPMTLPCTGPFILGGLSLTTIGASSIEAEIIYFIAFGIGFGWPLLVLPLLAAPLQKQFTGWLTRNHTLLNRISGALLILIGLFGFYTEFIAGTSSIV